MTFGVRTLKTDGVGSERLSKTLMTPLFSATKTRPSAANRISVGLTRPDQTADSWNAAGMAASTAGSVVVAGAQLASWRGAAFPKRPSWHCAAGWTAVAGR